MWCSRLDGSPCDLHTMINSRPSSRKFFWTRSHPSQGTKAVFIVCDALLYSSVDISFFFLAIDMRLANEVESSPPGRRASGLKGVEADDPLFAKDASADWFWQSSSSSVSLSTVFSRSAIFRFLVLACVTKHHKRSDN